jgi:hypothetical protein
MPGMGPDPHATATVLVLAELALFWTTAVLHLLRLVGLQGSSRTERLADAGHVAMGLGMAIMLFQAFRSPCCAPRHWCSRCWPPCFSLWPSSAEPRPDSGAKAWRSA